MAGLAAFTAKTISLSFAAKTLYVYSDHPLDSNGIEQTVLDATLVDGIDTNLMEYAKVGGIVDVEANACANRQ